MPKINYYFNVFSLYDVYKFPPEAKTSQRASFFIFKNLFSSFSSFS